MDLIERLKKCGCNRISYREELDNWYMIELIYNKRYYRFFALSFKELEIQSLRKMRRINRHFEMKSIKRGEQFWLEK